MAFIYALDPTAPANTDLVKDGAADMRLIKNALIERVQSFFQNVDSDPWVAKAGVTFAGNFTQSAGTASLQATTCTTLTATSNVAAGAAAQVRWTGRTILTAPADGQILATDNAGTAFTRLMLGGVTASYPAITRSGTLVLFRLADNSAYTGIQALGANFDANVTVSAGGITITGNSTITGTLGGVTTFTVTTVTATNLGGTLSTAAQPNVTSVGTLTSLNTTGTVKVTHASQAIFDMTYTGAGALHTTLSAFNDTAAWFDETNARYILRFTSSTNTLSSPAVISFSNGLNVTSGTTAVQALTATTGTFTGAILNSGATTQPFTANGQTTGETYARFINTNGHAIIGANASVTVISGGTAYSAFFGSNTNTVTELIANGNVLLRLTNATTRVDVVGANLVIPAAKLFYLDGGSDTYIYESSANIINFVAGGTSTLLINGGASQYNFQNWDITIAATKKLYLDGGGDTYIYESAANTISVYTGGAQQMIIGGGTGLRLPTLSSSVSGANMYFATGVNDQVYYVTSSRNVKKDIRSMTLEEARFIFKSRPVTFRSIFEHDGDSRYAGFISEEIIELDRMYATAVNSETPGVQYDRFVAPLTVIVTDHEKRLTQLEAQHAPTS